MDASKKKRVRKRAGARSYSRLLSGSGSRTGPGVVGVGAIVVPYSSYKMDLMRFTLKCSAAAAFCVRFRRY